MQTLPASFRYDDYDFTLIKRQGPVALLSKHKDGHKLTHYEVVILQTHPAQSFPSGKSYPEREAMPPTESWGTLGWTPHDLLAAERRFQKTVDSLQEG